MLSVNAMLFLDYEKRLFTSGCWVWTIYIICTWPSMFVHLFAVLKLVQDEDLGYWSSFAFIWVWWEWSPKFCLGFYRYTDKSDVFSFGVILGVLLTGRDPLDPFFGESASGGSLGRWLRHLQQAGEAQQALDKSILGQEVEEDEMLMVVRIAVVCMSDLPEDRPSSDELVPMLSRLHSFWRVIWAASWNMFLFHRLWVFEVLLHAWRLKSTQLISLAVEMCPQMDETNSMCICWKW